MATNFIDYDVVTNGEHVYSNQAQAIGGVIDTIVKMNADLEQGWSNDTARAFIERIGSDHIPKLRAAQAAIDEVATFIHNYLANKQEEDRQGASSLHA